MSAPEPATGGLRAVLLANREALLRFLQARGAGTEAEDILQELWLKLATRPPSAPVSEPLGYLHRMAHNLMHDRTRTAIRRRGREAAWWEDRPAEAPSAEDALLVRDDLADAERALDELGERTRSIFYRFRIGLVPQKVIAAEEGISLSAVEKHLQRAYRAVSALAARRDAEEADPRRPSPKDERDGE